MSRPRSGIGTELVPLVLILAGLAGSLALIVAVHRKAATPRVASPPVAVALPPSPPAPKPAPIPVQAAPEPEPEEPEPPPPPAPEDPTPKVLAKLTAAEADQLLEASKAERRAAALDEARKAAERESEKWRRREALVRLQLDSLDSKVRKLETEVDEMALERDALEKEVDARKAMAAQVKTRPSTAILPHRGQNGTWRRPIVIECTNGMATLQPQGIGFGLLELASGFGPATNPFVATVAREAIRIQGSHSPDGQMVVPYIFFLVRPDGIRAYYEARGRLEPLGITFGYELADQDWEIDFPDLDDVRTWDGSPSGLPDSLVKKPPRPSPAEDNDFPVLTPPRRSASSLRNGDPNGDFTWPRSRGPQGGGAQVAQGLEPMRGAPTPRSGLRFSNSSDNRGTGTSDSPDGTDPGGPPYAGGLPGGANAVESGLGGASGPSGLGLGSGAGMVPGPGSGNPPPPPSAAPRELALGSGPIMPLAPANPPRAGRPSGTSGAGAMAPAANPASPGSGPRGDASTRDDAASTPSKPKTQAKDDPANTFVWPSSPTAGPGGKPVGRSVQPPTGDGSDSGDSSPPVRHVGPFSKPLAMGLDSVPYPSPPAASDPYSDADPTQPDGPAGDPSAPSPRTSQGGSPGGASRPKGAPGAPSNVVQGIGQGGSPNAQPPQGMVGVGLPSLPTDGTPPSGMTPPPGMMPPPGMTPPSGMTPPPGQPKRSSSGLPDMPSPSIVDRRFEMVLVCGPRGVIVQPGGYRVTSDALTEQDGLLRKQVVALVKAKRTADPKTIIEPRVRFLIQPGGDKNYWTARSQFLLTGLDWPMTTQVADPDHLTILPSESW